MTTYRREIRLGSLGNDCIAVKRALARAGFGDLKAKGTWTPVFGPFAVQNLKKFQKKVGLPASGVFGARTFKKLLPHFDAYSRSLYAVPKDKALAKARAMVEFGKQFDNTYVWGGEHDGTVTDDSPHGRFDCSSSVSFLLWRFGLYPSGPAEVSGDFESYGESGRGKYVTVHANWEHVWIEFDLPEGWCRFDTSPHGCGSHGPRIRTCPRGSSTFVHRHPKGL